MIIQPQSLEFSLIKMPNFLQWGVIEMESNAVNILYKLMKSLPERIR